MSRVRPEVNCTQLCTYTVHVAVHDGSVFSHRYLTSRNGIGNGSRARIVHVHCALVHLAMIRRSYKLTRPFWRQQLIFCQRRQRVERRQGFNPYASRLGHQSEKRFALEFLYSSCKCLVVLYSMFTVFWWELIFVTPPRFLVTLDD